MEYLNGMKLLKLDFEFGIDIGGTAAGFTAQPGTVLNIGLVPKYDTQETIAGSAGRKGAGNTHRQSRRIIIQVGTYNGKVQVRRRIGLITVVPIILRNIR